MKSYPTNTRRLSAWQTVLFSALLAGELWAQSPPNTLSEEEETAGYDLLFNGRDLNNWHAYRESAVTDAWAVRTNDPLGPRIENGNGRKVPVLTDKRYMNFDLKIDFQTPPGGNAGIFTRYEENAESYWRERSGPELQICGPEHSDCQSSIHTVGSCYDMFPVARALRDTWYNPPGEWNQIRIVAFDSNYVHYGNGLKLLEYKIGTEEFMAAYNRSQYASDGNNGNYYDIHPGGILLQHHGETGMTFRNIIAKELDVHPFTREFPSGEWPSALDQEFVFGKRGCTDATADNYDPTAEVNDGTCEEVEVKHRPDPALTARLIHKSGEWRIRLPSSHTSIRLYATSGVEIELQKTQSTSEYSIPSEVTPGLYFLKVVRSSNQTDSESRLLAVP